MMDYHHSDQLDEHLDDPMIVRPVTFRGDRETIITIANSATPITTSFERAELHAMKIPSYIDQEVLQIIRRETLNPNGAGALLLHDVPVGDDIPPTPMPGELVSVPVADQLMLAIATIVGGLCIGYREEHGGGRFQDVIAHDDNKFDESAIGSRVELRCHMENVEAGTSRPDIGILICLRYEPAITPIIDIRRAIQACPANVKNELRKPQFHNPLPRSWGFPSGSLFGPFAIVDPDGAISYDDIDCTADTTAGNDAISILRTKMELYREDVTLRAGDALLIFHRRVIHGRKPFTPNEDPRKRRWLRRAHIASCRVPRLQPDGVVTLNEAFQ